MAPHTITHCINDVYRIPTRVALLA